MRRRALPTALALAFAFACTGARVASADTIILTSGRSIQAEQAWYEGEELRFRAKGALYRVPRALVARVESPAGGLLDPDVRRSRERLAAGDPAEALRFARLGVFRDPTSVPALVALSAAQTALGDFARGRQSAESALSFDGSSAAAHERLGDAQAELADFEGARASYGRALALDPQPGLQRKLDGISATAGSVSSARFRVRYDGAADEPLGLAVLKALDAAWDDHARRLGFTPGQPVTVVLQTAQSFRDTTRAPEWAAAWNDGTIRLPVMGLATPTPGLVRVLRHELGHSFIASRAPACPTWLQEGVAQWLEGGDPAREDALLAPLARAGRLRKLESLEQPFVGLGEADATTAYAQSLSAVAFLVRTRGEAALRLLIETIGAGRPAAEALPVAVSLSYGELQGLWERHLATRQPGVKAAGPSVHGAGL